MNKEIRTALFFKITLYYAAVIAVLWVIAVYFPDWLEDMPFGGLDQFKHPGDASNTAADFKMELDKFKLFGQSHHLFVDSINLVTALIGIIIIMIPVRWIYMGINAGKPFNPAVATSLFLLPMVVTAIIGVIKFSLVLAFALTGIFAGVRYRTTLKNQTDAFFLFAAIAAGLGAGTRSMAISLVLVIFFSYAILIFPPVNNPEDGKPSEKDEHKGSSDQ